MDMDHASSSSHPDMKYDVFLSFRDKDTRENFTSHLHAALIQKKISTYVDSSLQRRDVSPIHETFQAIQNSKVAIVILSQDYAASILCLNELVHVLECRERNGLLVIPIFYGVDRSSVRKQRGKYGEAFARLKSRYLDRLNEWRDALTLVANIAGLDLSDVRADSKKITAVVQYILKYLDRILPSDDFEGLVGIHESNKEIESLLDIDSPKVLILGIWGMGGIGKTTLAEVVFKRLSFQFEACFFLPNVREEWENGRKRYYLQNKLFYGLLGEEHQHMDTLILRNFDKERLRRKKVFIVLDDVDRKEQLEYLAGDRKWFGAGSRIIITTRDLGVVLGKVDAMFQVKNLDFDDALLLFSVNAFSKTTPPVDYLELSKSFVNLAVGIPLALKHLGSLLAYKRKKEWESALNKVKNDDIAFASVFNALEISYDALDEIEKSTFLDIACFLKGEDKDFAARVLEGFGFSADLLIEALIDKSLVEVNDSNKLWMDDLIQRMGRRIVSYQSTKEPGERSRLWNAQDIYHVLKHNTETAAIEGIFLDMCRTEMVDLCPTTFSKMNNLRMLKLHSRFGKCILRVPEDLQSLPEALRYLYWDEYPFKSLPPRFTGENLVELKMKYSKVERLWQGVQRLENLKVIDLSFSKQLIEIPNLSQAPNIESVSLRFCRLLREVPCYFQDLYKLTSLNLSDCSSLDKVSALPRNIIDVNLTRCVLLKSLPIDIFAFDSLKQLELSGCSNFDYMKFPQVLEFLESLE